MHVGAVGVGRITKNRHGSSSSSSNSRDERTYVPRGSGCIQIPRHSTEKRKRRVGGRGKREKYISPRDFLVGIYARNDASCAVVNPITFRLGKIGARTALYGLLKIQAPRRVRQLRRGDDSLRSKSQREREREREEISSLTTLVDEPIYPVNFYWRE